MLSVEFVGTTQRRDCLLEDCLVIEAFLLCKLELFLGLKGQCDEVGRLHFGCFRVAQIEARSCWLALSSHRLSCCLDTILLRPLSVTITFLRIATIGLTMQFTNAGMVLCTIVFHQNSHDCYLHADFTNRTRCIKMGRQLSALACSRLAVHLDKDLNPFIHNLLPF